MLGMSRLLMFLLISGIYLYFTSSEQPLRQAFVLIAMALFTLNHFLYHRIPAFWWLVALDMALVTAFGFLFIGTSTLYQIMFGVIGVTVMIRTDKRSQRFAWVTAVILLWGSIVFTEYQVVGKMNWISNLMDFGFFLFACLVGSLIHFYRKAQMKITQLYGDLDNSHSALQEAHAQLGDYARQVELLTATRERNRIAREIHDTVGHTMTSLLVQLQVARRLQEKDLSASQEALLRCEGLARSALQEVRLSVRALQEAGESVALLDSLRQLLAEFSHLSEVEVELQVQGMPSVISTTLEPVMYRIVQESLTNAKRHGQATQVQVSLCCTPEQIRLEILDNGEGSGEWSAGFGLMQMRERVHEQGGTITFSSEKGQGFAVRVSFPLQEQTWRYGGRQG